jgi:hypothetical protein
MRYALLGEVLLSISSLAPTGCPAASPTRYTPGHLAGAVHLFKRAGSLLTYKLLVETDPLHAPAHAPAHRPSSPSHGCLPKRLNPDLMSGLTIFFLNQGSLHA